MNLPIIHDRWLKKEILYAFFLQVIRSETVKIGKCSSMLYTKLEIINKILVGASLIYKKEIEENTSIPTSMTNFHKYLS